MDRSATDPANADDGGGGTCNLGWKLLDMMILLKNGLRRVYRRRERRLRLMTNGFFRPAIVTAILALALPAVLPTIFCRPICLRGASLGCLAGFPPAFIGAAPMPPVAGGADVKRRLALMTGALKTNCS